MRLVAQSQNDWVKVVFVNGDRHAFVCDMSCCETKSQWKYDNALAILLSSKSVHPTPLRALWTYSTIWRYCNCRLYLFPFAARWSSGLVWDLQHSDLSLHHVSFVHHRHHLQRTERVRSRPIRRDAANDQVLTAELGDCWWHVSRDLLGLCNNYERWRPPRYYCYLFSSPVPPSCCMARCHGNCRALRGHLLATSRLPTVHNVACSPSGCRSLRRLVVHVRSFRNTFRSTKGKWGYSNHACRSCLQHLWLLSSLVIARIFQQLSHQSGTRIVRSTSPASEHTTCLKWRQRDEQWTQVCNAIDCRCHRFRRLPITIQFHHCLFDYRHLLSLQINNTLRFLLPCPQHASHGR